jgi:hypothetical protein
MLAHDQQAALALARDVYVALDRAARTLGPLIGVKPPTTWEP